MTQSILLAWTLLAGASRAAPPQPNIVVLDICSARADRFGPREGRASLTPGLDAFAAQAATFENAWAQSSWCLPNYATLLTGLRPEAHGVYANLPVRPLPDWQPTVAEKLRQSGYRTAGFTAGAYTLPFWGLDRGFDAYVNRFSTAEARPGRFADMAPEIEKWISRESSRPFFVYATVDDLHAPYQGDEEEDGLPAVDTMTAGVRFFRAYNGEPLPDGDPLAAELAAFRGDPSALRSLTARYDAAVRAADRAIARFLAGLGKSGRWDDTLVIVTADHGESLGEHGLLGHTEGLYEPVLRVPLLVRHPRYPASAGARIKALVERVDLPATMLESAGAGGLELQGRSLLPLLADPAAPWRRYAYASSKRNVAGVSDPLIDERALRDERWKLIWSSAKGRWELYDLLEDPLETRDLSQRRADVVARLAFELQRQAEEARTHASGRPSGRVDGRVLLEPPQEPR